MMQKKTKWNLEEDKYNNCLPIDHTMDNGSKTIDICGSGSQMTSKLWNR